jgi:hypothetical protein
MPLQIFSLRICLVRNTNGHSMNGAEISVLNRLLTIHEITSTNLAKATNRTTQSPVFHNDRPASLSGGFFVSTKRAQWIVQPPRLDAIVSFSFA